MIRHKQNGFAVVESILIILIIAMITGIGWYVWRSKQKTEQTLNDASRSLSSSPSKAAKKDTHSTIAQTKQYLVIKEWNVRIPYGVDDAYSYRIPTGAGDNLIEVISKKLADTYGCTTYGAGEISRSLPSAPALPTQDQPTVKEYASQHPEMYKVLGSYYYKFIHDQALCSDSTSASAAQNDSNLAVSQLLQKLEPTPQ